jgi:hypothetical protein
MSNSSRTLDDLLALSRPCRYCGADEGVWCVVANGRTAGKTTPWLHQDRVELIQASHVLGYMSGRASALAEVETEIQTAGGRFTDLPADPTVDQVLAFVQQRHETAREWITNAMDRRLSTIPAGWRRG